MPLVSGALRPDLLLVARRAAAPDPPLALFALGGFTQALADLVVSRDDVLLVDLARLCEGVFA